MWLLTTDRARTSWFFSQQRFIILNFEMRAFSLLSLGCCGCIACDYERDGCTLKLINVANGPSRIVLVSGFRFARSSAVSARNVTGCAVMKMKTDVTFQLMILTQKKIASRQPSHVVLVTVVFAENRLSDDK